MFNILYKLYIIYKYTVKTLPTDGRVAGCAESRDMPYKRFDVIITPCLFLVRGCAAGKTSDLPQMHHGSLRDGSKRRGETVRKSVVK